MGIIKDKVTGFIQKATTTATQTVKDITKEDASRTLDMLGDIAKIGIFTVLTIGAFKSSSTPAATNVIKTVEPVARAAQATAPVVQIFLGEGKGVHIG